ncbi:F-box protein At3g58530 [Physcomitrium patens]|uniref:F-box/LRR-repeat protein 15-like leucin rich repeat domain-containing protein n=1 Tax=Physcomitrium patens TaxID=3218 RepID=A0A2K1IHY1_PHYPA|nr:F-box protein At3g58530-like [Physcomitrium patens]XP_024362313.1 F-box protein At3g58530-like [Physcomitrium patens]XP_024362314.1 F-box protein At3g58530-like [Physcomitrium patens]PNR28886.1 hypothetical protein PHYPA_027578 [Physcomitrium patens]|eukprot:XP_024362312.1 F-box protein At3g58530-like [Physcomitrella patens]
MGVDLARSSEESDRDQWGTEVVPHVMQLVSSYLGQRDVCALLCVSTSIRHLLTSHAPLWKILDLRNRKHAGETLVVVLAQKRFRNVEEINLEFAQDVEDKHLTAIAFKSLRRINLNACQKVTNSGVIFVASANPSLTSFSIYWNLKVTDAGIEAVVRSCKDLRSLNISGCKSLTDRSLRAVAKHGQRIQILNLTRGVKLTDEGLVEVINACREIVELYLYASPNFTDTSFITLSKLSELRVLDLCGAHLLSDDGLSAISECSKLETLNLTWCINITDVGLTALAQHCSRLQSLSLHGLLGVSDEGLESLAACCGSSLIALDVNGCINVKRRSKEELRRLFPNLKVFLLHT